MNAVGVIVVTVGVIVVTVVLDVVSSICPEVVWIIVPIIDNVDVADIDVVVGELVCCIVVPVVIGVGGHVRGTQLVMHLDGAVEQSC
jgi:hypothetical protein